VAVDANYHFKALNSVSPYVELNVNFGSYSRNITETAEGLLQKLIIPVQDLAPE